MFLTSYFFGTSNNSDLDSGFPAASGDANSEKYIFLYGFNIDIFFNKIFRTS